MLKEWDRRKKVSTLYAELRVGDIFQDDAGQQVTVLRKPDHSCYLFSGSAFILELSNGDVVGQDTLWSEFKQEFKKVVTNA